MTVFLLLDQLQHHFHQIIDYPRLIARALVSQPRIFLADEPTAALNKQSGRDVVDLMQKLAKEQGCTILLSNS